MLKYRANKNQILQEQQQMKEKITQKQTRVINKDQREKYMKYLGILMLFIMMIRLLLFLKNSDNN